MVKALIVDDSEESRIILRRILSKSLKVEIIEAANGNDALKKIPIHKPDIVFLDYKMPSMDGRETLKAIRSNPNFKNLPVVIVSSYSERELVKELLLYKITAYLVKPLDNDYVIKLMKAVFPKFNDEI